MTTEIALRRPANAVPFWKRLNRLCPKCQKVLTGPSEYILDGKQYCEKCFLEIYVKI